MLEELFRHDRCGGGDDDPVVGCILWPAFPAITGSKLHIVNVEIAQSPSGLSQQFGNALHGVDLLDERCEYRGLVSATGADLEDLLAVEAVHQGLGHLCNDVRLADRLAMTDRQRRVFVSPARQRLVDEQVPWHVADLVQHGLRVDAVGAQALDQPVAGPCRRHADAGDTAPDLTHPRASPLSAAGIRAA